MISKTQRLYNRRVDSSRPGNRKLRDDKIGVHRERVLRETWWVLWIIPVFVRESILSSDL